MDCSKNVNSSQELQKVNIRFEDLHYFVKISRTEKKHILKGINGNFYGGKLTAILGASGAGKSTLLNALAGYTTKGIKGNISINDVSRDLRQFRKISTYIMQKDLVQPYLTVEEQLIIVSKLKLDIHTSIEDRKKAIDYVIKLMSLSNCVNTRVEDISGGERKRLSIALDLINKPPVIFLDEPTSGLDSFTVNMCIVALKHLAQQGNTVICTVHQPSSYMMEQFDQVYILADGLCVYNGSTPNIPSFLKSVNLECPITYGSSDYIIETVETNPSVTRILSKVTRNGKIDLRPIESSKISSNCRNNIQVPSTSPSFWTQFNTILGRMILQQQRNKAGLVIQFLSHAICGFLYGAMFMKVKNNGKFALFNFYLCFVVAIFFLYNYFMKNVIMFPFELEITKREYLNRWYDSKPYYLALAVRNFPAMVIFGFTFMIIMYTMTCEAFEWERFIKMTVTAYTIAITSEGMGLIIGCLFNSFIGSVLGPASAAPLILFTLYGIGYGATIPLIMKIITKASFMRFGVIACMYALLEDRPPFECDSGDICLYKNYWELFDHVGVSSQSYYVEMLILASYGLMFHFIAYLILRYRLKNNFTSFKLEQLLLKILGSK